MTSTPAPRPAIAVLGSLNMDLVMRLARVPDAGETVAGAEFAALPGGKGANQAVACARLGARTALIGAVGDDAHGAALLDALRADGVDTTQVARRPDAPTGVASIWVDARGENRIVVAPGANARLDTGDVQAAEAVLAQSSMLLLQLEVPLATVMAAAARARAAGARVLLNPSPAQSLPDALVACVDVLVLNETEAAQLTRQPVRSPAEALEAARALQAQGPTCVLVTLGAEGVAWRRRDRQGHAPARPVRAVDTTAAGDTFAGALAVALAEGRSLEAAIAFAQSASALCVTRHGAQPSIPHRGELDGLPA